MAETEGKGASPWLYDVSSNEGDESFDASFELELPKIDDRQPQSPEYRGQYWSKRTQLKWTLTLFVGCALAYASRTSISIASVSISKELGWDKRLSGMVMSSFFCGYILTQVFGGVLADRYGGDWMLFLSGITWATCTLLLPLMDVIPVIDLMPPTAGIMVARGMAGIAQGVHFPAFSSLLSKRVPVDSRSSTFTFSASGTMIGTVFSGFVGSFLLEHSGWRSLFLVIGTVSVLWAGILYFFIWQDRQNLPTPEETIGIVKEEPMPWLKLIWHKSFWALMVLGGCESWIFMNLLSWMPTYFHEEFPKSKGWLFNVIPWIACFVSQNICGVLADRMISSGVSITKVRKFFVNISLLPPVGLCLLLQKATSFEMALILMSMVLASMGCITPGLGMNCQDLAPRHTGSMFGTMNTVAALTGTLGVYVTGHILHTTNQWAHIFQMTSFLALLGSVTFTLFGTGKAIV